MHKYRFGSARQPLSSFILTLPLLLVVAAAEGGQRSELVRLQTEDGWTLYGGLHLPDPAPSSSLAAVLLVAQPGWLDRSIFEEGGDPLGPAIVKRGLAVLAIDPRGHRASQGPKEVSFFSREELEKFQLDIRASVRFLVDHAAVDGERIGVFAPGITANHAVLEAAENPAISALVLMSGGSGSLGFEALDVIAARGDIPILALAGKQDREAIPSLAKAFSLSQNRNSDLILAKASGLIMFPSMPGLKEEVADWLSYNLGGLGRSQQIKLKTQDGWTLRGRLRIPEAASESSKVPGLVFVHGAKNSQSSFWPLEREIVKRGVATLNYDWRGKDPTIAENQGLGIYGIEISNEAEVEDLHLDVEAAIDTLAGQAFVDENRIVVVGASRGSGAVAKAVVGDPRIRGLVFLTAYPAGPEFEEYISSHDVPIFSVSSSADYGGENQMSMTEKYHKLSKSPDSRLLMFVDSASRGPAHRGTGLLQVKPDLQPMVLEWILARLQ